MKWKRTAMSLALAGCMMATTVPVTAFAAQTSTTMASEQAVGKKEISFAQTSGTIVEKTATTLSVNTTADNPVRDGKNISWESSDPTVANFANDTTPNADGKILGFSQKIIANKPGKTTITATFTDVNNNNATQTVSYELTVVARKAFTGFSLDATKVELTTADDGKGNVVDTTGSKKTVAITADTNDVVTYTTDVYKVAEHGGADDEHSDVVKASVVDGKVVLEAQKPGKAMVKVTATATYDNQLDKDAAVETKTEVKWIEVVVNQMEGTDVLSQFEIKTEAGNQNGAVPVNKTIQLVPYFNGAPNGVQANGYDPTTGAPVSRTTYTGDKTVKWTSNNPQYATVDQNGLVTGVAEGKSDIYATAANGLIAHATIDVTKEVIAVTNIEFKVKDMSVPVGGINQESIVFTPENATEINGPVAYSIVNDSNTNANGDAIINEELFEADGTVYGMNTGTVQVQAVYTTGAHNERTLVAYGTVTVTKEGSLSQVTDISIKGGDRVTGSAEGTIALNGSIALPDYNVKPAVCKDYTAENVTWKVADESIAKIVGGRVVGLKNGTTTLTATVNGVSSTIMIEVTGTSKLTGVELDIHNVTVVLPGETTKDNALIVDLGAGVKTSSADVPGGLIWTSSDESIVTVTDDGQVHFAEGVKAGTATITVTAGNYSDTCVVKVIDPDTIVNPTINFVDVPANAWYHDAVYAAAEKGLMNGVGDNKFEPLKTVQRSQVATIIWNMKGAPAATGTTPFTDVPANAWYTQAVTWAYQNQVVAGTSETTFGPNLYITREDFVGMLYNEAGKPKAEATGDLSKFVDANEVDSWATDAVKWGVAKGIINGNEKKELNPTDTLTRAEAAAIMVNYVG